MEVSEKAIIPISRDTRYWMLDAGSKPLPAWNGPTQHRHFSIPVAIKQRREFCRPVYSSGAPAGIRHIKVRGSGLVFLI
jgi:hypothetical protein